MTDLRTVPLPRLPPGPVNGEQLQTYLELLVREVLSKADVRNAIGQGITITADGNVVATLDASSAITTALATHNADAAANPAAIAAHAAVTSDVHAAADYAQTDVVETITEAWKFSDGIVFDKAAGIGIKVDTSSPTYGWKDMTGDIKTRTGGASAPSFAVYRGTIYQFKFGTVPGEFEVFNEFHLQHDWVPGTDLYVHSHWSTADAPTGTADWMFDVIYAKGYGQDQFEGTDGSGTVITVGTTTTADTAFRHYISEVVFTAPGGVINPNAATVSITSGAAVLTANIATWTNADIGKTVRVIGAGAAGANLDTTISAFTSTTQVTLAANAGTTVTAQPNFRWRVIDIDNVEVDGLVIVRTWRNAARASDSLDVAPYVHFVDCHYQCTFGGTKQRNGPNFYT